MKAIWFFLALLLALTTACDQSASPQRNIENPFPNAVEVRLFVETGYDSETRTAIWSKAEGVRLSSAQRVQFENALIIEPMPEEMIGCFIPHHFFRYFDKNGNKIGEVEICFCCGGARASGSDALVPAADEILSADYQALEQLVQELGEPTDVMCD